MKRIILASASPRRKELLEHMGLKFEVEPSHYQEETYLELRPHERAKIISLEKAKAVAQKHPNAIIIAADTIVLFRGKMLGKPHTEAEAKEMLSMMNGRSHSVITGFTIVDTENNKTVTKSVATKVYFKKLTPGEIEAYVKSKEPLDKAGAYAIQGLGSVLVARIEGDYSNVVGLPLSALAEALKEFGINITKKCPKS